MIVVKPVTKILDKGEQIFTLNMPEMTFKEGAIYALIGANGSGKSTYGKYLLQQLKPQAGYMAQKSYAFNMSVEKNIMVNSANSIEDRQKCAYLMEKLKLTSIAKRNAKAVSGGENARMALARIMMKDYRLLVLDEPTAAMDQESTLASEQLIKEYCRNHSCSIVLITHSLAQAKRLADEVIFMDNGRPVEMGSSEELLDNPKKEETKRYIEFYGY